MIKRISRFFTFLLFLIFISSCSTSKKEGEREVAFKKYLDTRKIDIKTLNDSNYTDYYLEFLSDEKKNILSNNTFLKVNKVYVYQGDIKEITFCIFSDDGYLYMAEAFKQGGELLTEPKDGKIELRRPFDLIFLGFFEIKDTNLKISRHKKTPSGEVNQSDHGYIMNDTITLTSFYNTTKYSYDKKWLAKTHKTNFKLVYQPNLEVKKSKNELGFNTFQIEGSFNAEKN